MNGEIGILFVWGNLFEGDGEVFVGLLCFCKIFCFGFWMMDGGWVGFCLLRFCFLVCKMICEVLLGGGCWFDCYGMCFFCCVGICFV